MIILFIVGNLHWMENFNFDIPPRFEVHEDNDIPNTPCTYKNVGKLDNLATDCMNGSMSMLMYNIRSCRKNFSTFVAFLCSLMVNFSFIVLVETWLSVDTDHGFNMQGYKQVNIYRDNFGCCC